MLSTFETPAGQRIAFREFGAAGGQPVFFFHGWPGECQQGSLLHEAALKQNVRLICPNRPGIHGSSPQPGRTLLDWPPLVAALADFLKIGRFRLLGLSGGGPYALATAWALGNRVIACTTVCGALPAAPGPDRRFLSPVYRAMLSIHDHAPWLLQGALIPVTRLARIPPPRPLLWLGLRTLGPSDRAALWPRENFPHFWPAFKNSMQSGMSGLWEDGKSYSSPWPFDPAAIRCPLTIWHGTQDRNFDHKGAAALASTIPHAKYFETNDGHYSILKNQAEPILKNLLTS
ncbi:MAG: alpha/beta hydrolase [Verrucomicrobiales bacterium]|nr:alpha/beta hydrolase [Verrucomicrobiales bacterium]